MSVSFEGEVTVLISQKTYLATAANSFYEDDWDTLETLSRSLPTKPGYYEAVEEYPMGGGTPYHPYYLSPDGQWYSVNGGFGDEETPEDMQSYGRLVLLGSKAGD